MPSTPMTNPEQPDAALTGSSSHRVPAQRILRFTS
jgi:hypothetical protein